jgi:hypothetical protein
MCYEAWEDQGPAALAETIKRKPWEFVKIVAGLMPQKLEITNKFQSLPDAELAALSPELLRTLPREQMEDLLRDVLEIKEVLSRRRLNRYEPYPKQIAFHTAGAHHRERLLMAGNQLGKTYAGGAECAYHLTGRYPEWWEGRRFDHPVRAWAGSKGSEATRDGIQRILLGEPKDRAYGEPGSFLATILLTRASGRDWRIVSIQSS